MCIFLFSTGMTILTVSTVWLNSLVRCDSVLSSETKNK